MSPYAPRDFRGWKPFKPSVFFLPVYLPFLVIGHAFRDCFALLCRAPKRWYTGLGARTLGTPRAGSSASERK